MSRIKTSKIRDIRDIRGKKITTDCFAYSTFGLGSQIMKLLCLADEGSNSLRFSNSKVKSHHRFYGCHGLKHIKSVTSVTSVVKKTHLCLADEGSNSSRFYLIEKKEPQILRMLQIITNKISDIRGKKNTSLSC
jgi:hypothetical protein